jgi:transposase
MSLAELVITSVKLEGRTKSEVARDYKVSRYWVHQLVKRYEAEGEAAFQPRSRRPHHNSRAVGSQTEERIVRLRKELDKRGLDAGAETIWVHLQRDPSLVRVPAVSTIWRILTRRGFVTPQPRKRPKSAGLRFEAAMRSPAQEALRGARRRGQGWPQATHRAPALTPSRTTSHSPSAGPEMQRCPETPVNGVSGHHRVEAEGIRTPDLLIARRSSPCVAGLGRTRRYLP